MSAMATSTVYSCGFSPVLYAQVKDEFRILDAAASKAEEAASRYETHTTGLLQANNASVRKDIGETSDLGANCYLPPNAPPIAEDTPESYEARVQHDNIEDKFAANDDGPRSFIHQISSHSVPEACSNLKCDIETSQNDGLPPSLNAKMLRKSESLPDHKVTDFQTEKNSTLVSSARMSKSRSSASQSSPDPLDQSSSITTDADRARKRPGSTPLTSKVLDQREQHKLPKPVVEWMNGGGRTASGSTIAQSRCEIQEPPRIKKPPRPRSSSSQTSSALKNTQGAFGTAPQTSNIRTKPTPNSDAVEATSSSEKKSSVPKIDRSATENLPLHLANDLAFTQVFKDTIYTYIKSSENEYRGRVPDDILRTIGKSVANQIVTQSLRNLVRESSYDLGNAQKRMIRNMVKSLYSAKAAGSIARISLANRNNRRSEQHFRRSSSDGSEGLSGSVSSTSPKKTLLSAKPSSHTSLSETPPSSPFFLTHGLRGLSKPLVVDKDRVPSAIHPSVAGTTTGDVCARIKLPDSATESKPPSSDLNSARKSELHVQDRKHNQHSSLIAPGEPAELGSTAGDRRREIDNVLNPLVNTTSSQPNPKKRLSVDLKLESEQEKKSLAQVRPSEEPSGEEDGDRVLASWLKAKLSEEMLGSKIASRSVKEFFAPRITRDVIPSAGTHSVPASSLHTVSKSVQSLHTRNLPTTLPKPAIPQVPKHPSSLSRLSLPTGVMGSATPEETVGCTISEGNAGSTRAAVRPTTRDPLQQASRLFPREEESPQRQDGPFQRRIEPTRRQERPSRHPEKSFQPTTSTAQPVIVGRPVKQDDPDLVKSMAELALHRPSPRRPYSSKKRARDYSPEQIHHFKHVDFSEEECEEIYRAWLAFDSPDGSQPLPELGPNIRTELQDSLQTISLDEMPDFVQYLKNRGGKILQGRSRRAIRAFLWDLVQGRVPSHPKCIRVEAQTIDPCHHPLRTTAALLRRRELGISGRSFRNVKTELQLRTSQKIVPWRSWKGASGDVVACAWAPSLDSTTYAVGAAAHTNEEDLQYNRPRNLLLGNLITNTLKELPDHRISRPRPETISRGPNSTQAVYDACDPMVYTTVSSLHFSRDGSCLYSASHDKTVKIWDVSSSSCVKTLDHDAWVSDLDVSSYFRDVFAAATKTIDKSIHIYFPESDDSSNAELSSVQLDSARAKSGRHGKLYPECLRWGRTLNTSQLLLAGFQRWGDTDGGRDRDGEICLWDVHAGVGLKVTPGSQSVFAATWHPTLDLFATGGSPSNTRALTHPFSTRSVVRTWDVRSLTRYAVEYECPAIDMQDVTFNPLHPNIVTAGCTDSDTYVWDFRRPDQFLHRLRHGRPLLDWDHSRPQEEGDPGVMMTLWGMQGALLYTGSSDGIVKSWDIMRAPEDVHVGDVGDLGAGVQSGAFSPDFSHLLVGDSDGGVHILSSGPVEGWSEGGDEEGCVRPIEMVPARDASQIVHGEDEVGREGIEAAQELVSSGRVVLDPRFGAGQGPNYGGPYAKHARVQADEPVPLLPEFEALQLFSGGGQQNVDVSRTRRNLMKERRRLMAERRGQQCSDDGDDSERLRSWRERPAGLKREREDDLSLSPRKKAKWAIVDLCTPSPPDGAEGESRTDLELISVSNGSRAEAADDSDISESEMVEENHWWPRMDEEVFAKLYKRW